jgi:hypothetical protein
MILVDIEHLRSICSVKNELIACIGFFIGLVVVVPVTNVAFIITLNRARVVWFILYAVVKVDIFIFEVPNLLLYLKSYLHISEHCSNKE